nr:HisA/HisF-related TIM barrel protein [Photobacterium swingsii]
MIIPALDLINGQVVRLFQGDYGQVTEYKVDPIEQFDLYHQAGANWLHLVDLTGAKDTSARQLSLIRRLLASTPAKVQIGGGVRTEQDVAIYLTQALSVSLLARRPLSNPNWLKAGLKNTGLNT